MQNFAAFMAYTFMFRAQGAGLLRGQEVHISLLSSSALKDPSGVFHITAIQL